jgi:NH3-dependent NAD+ synthetase
VIPPTTIQLPPTVELAEGQADSDNLPDYAVLDDILQVLVDRHGAPGDVAHDSGIVRRIARMGDAAEYKRRQAAPCVKITGMLFNRDRRVPITSAWRAA